MSLEVDRRSPENLPIVRDRRCEESHPKHSNGGDAYSHYTQMKGDSGDRLGTLQQASQQPHKESLRILGLRKRMILWLLIVLVTLLISSLIGVGVAGSLAARRQIEIGTEKM